MRILQLSSSTTEYICAFVHPKRSKSGKTRIFTVPVAQFGLVEVRKGETVAGPLIQSRTGLLIPAWEADDFIGCAPAEEGLDEDFWVTFHQEQEELKEAKKSKGRKSSKGKSPSSEPEEVPEDDDDDEDDEEEEDDDEDEEDDDDDDDDDDEEEEDDAPEGEVHLRPRTR